MDWPLFDGWPPSFRLLLGRGLVGNPARPKTNPPATDGERPIDMPLFEGRRFAARLPRPRGRRARHFGSVRPKNRPFRVLQAQFLNLDWQKRLILMLDPPVFSVDHLSVGLSGLIIG